MKVKENGFEGLKEVEKRLNLKGNWRNPFENLVSLLDDLPTKLVGSIELGILNPFFFFSFCQGKKKKKRGALAMAMPFLQEGGFWRMRRKRRKVISFQLFCDFELKSKRIEWQKEFGVWLFYIYENSLDPSLYVCQYPNNFPFFFFPFFFSLYLYWSVS